jgi:hypothetical protein
MTDTRPITMQDIRLVAGEGNLLGRHILDAVNIIIRQRAERSVSAQGQGQPVAWCYRNPNCKHWVTQDHKPTSASPYVDHNAEIEPLYALEPGNAGVSREYEIRGEKVTLSTEVDTDLAAKLTGNAGAVEADPAEVLMDLDDAKGSLATCREYARHLEGIVKSQWRSIETAPKDGSEILACFQGQFRWVMFVALAFGADSNAQGYAKPTHWMPLPAAPLPATQGDPLSSTDEVKS